MSTGRQGFGAPPPRSNAAQAGMGAGRIEPSTNTGFSDSGVGLSRGAVTGSGPTFSRNSNGGGGATSGSMAPIAKPGFGAQATVRPPATASGGAGRPPTTMSGPRPKGAAAAAGPSARAYAVSSSTSQGLDVRKAIASYFDRIVSAVQGMKVVLFDEDSKNAVSMVYTQSQILEKSVFLTASLTQKKRVVYDGSGFDEEKKEREKMLHLKGLILCRPTEENINEIVKQLDDPLYGEYHLFFTSPVHPTVLSRLAQADRSAVVKQVQEFYVDYIAINTDFFEFGLNDYLRLSRPRSSWNSSMELMFKRSIQEMLAVLLSLRQKPTIRFQSGSELASVFARELNHEMTRESQLFEFGNAAPASNSTGETLLLVLDRKEDPITPLLLQWTYQAMVHDIVGSGLKHNVVDLGQAWIERNPDEDDSREPDARMRAQKQEQRRSIVLSQSEEFFAKNMFKDYGLLAQNTKRMLDEYKEQVARNKNMGNSIEEMTRVVENMAEFKKIANNALKHAAVVGEITRVMGERHLIEVSTLEQSIACTSDHANHVEKLKDKIKDPKLHPEDKLRLALLYTLRYETHGGNRIPEIKQLLRANRVTEDRVKLLDAVINYAGTSKRNQMNYGSGADLFSGFVTMVKGVAQQSGVENVLTQHKPMLAKILEEARTGKLAEAKYPAVNASMSGSFGGSAAPGGSMAPPAKEVIVMILGGATYEEAAYVASVNSNPVLGATSPFGVLLGGTSVHNTRSFLAELASLTG